MVAFWNKDKNGKQDESAQEKKQASVAVSKKSDKKSPKKKKISADLKRKSELVNSVIVKPVISERAMNQQMSGKYVFEVAQKSTKQVVAEAVEVLYGVDVTKVNLMNYKKKKRNFRNFRGQQKALRKAIVTIKSGQEIKLFNE